MRLCFVTLVTQKKPKKTEEKQNKSLTHTARRSHTHTQLRSCTQLDWSDPVRLERACLLFALWKSMCFRNCLALGIPAFANTMPTVMTFKSGVGIATVAAICVLEISIPVAVARAVEHGTLVHAAVSVEDASSAHPLLKMLRWWWWWRWWSWRWTAPASLKRPLPAKVVVTVVPRSDI